MSKKVKTIYERLHNTYGPQGWWPIINNKTLLCEYHRNAPCNEEEMLEICIGAILTQGTQWYPNVVRALQQLKLGRELTKQELEVLKEAEIQQKKISGKKQKQTKDSILTQNTSWQNVERAIAELHKADLVSLQKLAKVNEEKLAQLIKSSGYFRQKAKKLKLFSKHVLKHGTLTGFLNQNNLREELLSVWGIGPETADSIVLYAAKMPSFVVDAYTRRIMSRLGVCKDCASYEELQFLFHNSLPFNHKLFNEYHALLVALAKSACTKSKPFCNSCPIKNLCSFYKKISNSK